MQAVIHCDASPSHPPLPPSMPPMVPGILYAEGVVLAVMEALRAAVQKVGKANVHTLKASEALVLGCSACRDLAGSLTSHMQTI